MGGTADDEGRPDGRQADRAGPAGYYARFKRLRRQLRRREAELRQIIDLAPFMVFVKDWEGRFRLVNRASAATFGMSVRELTGRRHDEVAPDSEQAQQMLADDFEVLASGEPKEIPRQVYRDPQGRPRIVRTMKIPFVSEIDGERAVLGIAEDITEQEFAERRFRLAIERAPWGMLMTDGRGRILTANAEAERILGYGTDELLGRPASSLVPERLRDQQVEPGPGLIPDPEREMIRSQDTIALRKDGTEVPVEVGMNPISGPDGLLVLSYLVDITDRKRAEEEVQALNAEMEDRIAQRTAELRATNEQLEQEIAERRKVEQQLLKARATLELANHELQELALKDPLTHLANRRHFDQCLEHEWRRASRTHQPLSLLIVDVDRFKQFNDELGHQAGDSCLCQVGHALARCLRRPADVIARYGGEEFAALLPDTGRDGARIVAETMCREVEAMRIPHPTGDTVAVTVSVGVASVRVGNTGGSAALVAMADEALYRAKDAGRNTVRAAPKGSSRKAAGAPSSPPGEAEAT